MYASVPAASVCRPRVIWSAVARIRDRSLARASRSGAQVVVLVDVGMGELGPGILKARADLDLARDGLPRKELSDVQPKVQVKRPIAVLRGLDVVLPLDRPGLARQAFPQQRLEAVHVFDVVADDADDDEVAHRESASSELQPAVRCGAGHPAGATAVCSAARSKWGTQPAIGLVVHIRECPSLEPSTAERRVADCWLFR